MLDLTKGYIDFPEGGTSPIPTDVNSMNMEAKIDAYEMLLAVSLTMRAYYRDSSVSIDNQEKIFPHIKKIIEWLRTTDFYTSPASTRYHDACTSGLLNHTLETCVQLKGLMSVPKFQNTIHDPDWWSAVFVVLVHDWCKIGRYESYLKNVLNNVTGVWEKIPAFRYKEDGTMRLGHGTQSLITTMQFCNSKLTYLNFEEMAAIRWHMDNWDIGTYDKEDLHLCDERIPMVRMVQFADQLAITTY